MNTTRLFDWGGALIVEKHAWVAEFVMGRTVKWMPNLDGALVPWIYVPDWGGLSAYLEMGCSHNDDWAYTLNPAADYSVLEKVMHGNLSAFVTFSKHLEATYVQRVAGGAYFRNVAACARYQVGDYSYAAYQTVISGEVF